MTIRAGWPRLKISYAIGRFFCVLTLYQTTKSQIQIKSICRWQVKCKRNSDFWLGKGRKHCGRRRKCWLPTFSLLFPQCFLKLSFSELLKVVIVWLRFKWQFYLTKLLFLNYWTVYACAFFVPVFSSHEHNMLRMSYCDRSLSGVHPAGRPCVRPSMNNYLKNLLLWNRPTDFNETSQKLSLGDALSEYFKDMNSMKNSGCHGNRKKKL